MDIQYRHTDSAAPKGTVLIAHGYAEHSGRFTAFHEVLLTAGYDVAFYDHYGHGTAPGPRARVDVGRLINDHLDARRITLTHCRTEDLFLFGHSMGGLITASSMLLDSTHLRGVILTGPAFRPLPPVPVWAARGAQNAIRLAPGICLQPLQKPGSPSVLSRDPRVQAAFDADPLTYKGGVPVLTGSTMIVQGDKALAHAHLATTPTLIFHGSADQLTAPEASRAFVEAARAAHPNADVHLRIVDGAYHEVLSEPEGPGLMRDIVMWLDAH